MGRTKDAHKSLKKAYQIRPDDAETHNNLAVVLDDLGKRDEAYQHYLEAIRLKPFYCEAIYNLALHYLEKDERAKAQQQLKVLEKVDFEFARELRKHIYAKYVLDASGNN